MPNRRVQERIQARIDAAINLYSLATAENHRGLQGHIREIAIDELLRPLLIDSVGIGTGKIIDGIGGESKQIDIVLYDRASLPPVMFGERLGLFPVESVMYAIEVKSTATAGEARSTIASARSVFSLAPMQGARRPQYAYFAFSSDLSSTTLLTELDRFREAAGDQALSGTNLVSICVAGSGYWGNDSRHGWQTNPRTARHADVLAFLCGILNTVPRLLAARQPLLFGYYFHPEQE